MKRELLQNNWFDLLDKLQADFSIGETIFTELAIAHTQASRHYHNLNHIEYLLKLADSVRELAQSPSAIELAAWFHDYVYDPRQQNNEVESALYAKRTLTQLKLDPCLVISVEQIILSTQKHQPLSNYLDNKLFLDLDLAILGEPQSQYWQYARAIRQEYSWLSDRIYQEGRKQVLTNFLERERIYYTDYFWQRREQQARANLMAEIKLLSG